MATVKKTKSTTKPKRKYERRAPTVKKAIEELLAPAEEIQKTTIEPMQTTPVKGGAIPELTIQPMAAVSTFIRFINSSITKDQVHVCEFMLQQFLAPIIDDDSMIAELQGMALTKLNQVER